MSKELISRETQRRLDKLDALEAGGVDNWEWYGESLKDWFKAGQVEEAVDSAIENINDLLVEAEVDQPAGPGCGYSIRIDEDRLATILMKFLEEANNE